MMFENSSYFSEKRSNKLPLSQSLLVMTPVVLFATWRREIVIALRLNSVVISFSNNLPTGTHMKNLGESVPYHAANSAPNHQAPSLPL